MFALLMLFACNSFIGAFTVEHGEAFSVFFGLTGIITRRNSFTGYYPTFSRFGQADFGINPKCQQFFFTEKAISETPLAGTVRMHQHKKTIPIKKFVGLGLWLSVTNKGVGQ